MHKGLSRIITNNELRAPHQHDLEEALGIASTKAQEEKGDRFVPVALPVT